MGSVSFVARTQRRQRVLASIVVAVVIGALGGLTMALVAGASRVGSVVDRYYAPATVYDLGAFGAPLSVEDVLAMPGVQGVARDVFLGAKATRVDGTPYVLNLVAMDGPPWDPMVRVRAGQPPAADDIGSIAVNQQALDDFGVRIGDELSVQLFTEDDFEAVADGQVQASGATVRLRVAALIDTPADLEAADVDGGSQMANMTEAVVPFGFYEQHVAAGVGDFGYGFQVDLVDPSAADAFKEAFSARAAEVLAEGGDLGSLTDTVQYSSASFTREETTLDAPANVQATVLRVLAAIAAVAGVVVLGLLLAADERVHAGDHPILGAAGMTRGQRSRLGLVRTLPATVCGAVLAGVVAVALSGLFPVGTVRALERDPGVDVNVAVVIIGVAVTVVASCAVALVAGRLAVRRRREISREPSRVTRTLGQLNAPVGAVVGGHLAFPGKGARRVVPAWQTIAVGAVAVAAVLGVAVYNASIGHLDASKSAHGFAWDAVIGNVNFQMTEAGQASLRGDERFASLVPARLGNALIDGQETDVMGIADDGNGISTTILRGRAPRTPAEVALGPRLMERLGVDVGDTVTLSLAGSDLAAEATPTPDTELTIVGSTLLPSGFGESDIADAAAVTMDALVSAGASPVPQVMLAQFRDGVDRSAAEADLRHAFPLWITTDATPAKIISLFRARVLLTSGAVVVAIMAVVLLLYTLATTARTMRRDLGVLRALGMRPRGVGNSVLWQGSLIAAAVLAIGVPVGLIAGRLVWRAVADQLGVAGNPTSPLWWFAVVPATVVVALLAATLPARGARRLHVTEVLPRRIAQ